MEKEINLDSRYAHKAIIRNMDDFQGGSFSTQEIDGNYYVKKGFLKRGGGEEIQSFSFFSNQYTEKQAKDFLGDIGVEYIKFIPAEEILDNNDETFRNDPFPNEHAARIKSPGSFQEGSFRRKNIAPGIDIIVGRLIGETTTTTQSYRFKKTKFTPEQAKKWLSEHKIKSLSFERAKKAENSSSEEDKKNETMAKKKDSVNHYDVFDDIELLLTSPFQKTDEGFLRGRAIVTNTGIFKYATKNNGVLSELRPNEEVFDEQSLESLKMIPITNSHPKYPVDSENAKKLQVGSTGSDVRINGHAVSIDMTITDGKTIDQIKQEGKVALSCGYRADLEYKTGFAFGNNQYDAVQRNIRYNHLAIVDKGRAGDLAKIRMDSLDAICINLASVAKKENNNIGEIMKKITIDGVEYEAEAKVIEAYSITKKDWEEKVKLLADKEEELLKLQAEKDTILDDLEKMKKENEKLINQDNQEKINKAVKERLSIIDFANKLEVEIDDSLNNLEIKKAVILKQYPNAKEKLDSDLGKNEIYINSRFDHISENITEKIASDNKKKVLSDALKNNKDNDNNDDYYEKYKKILENAYLNIN